MATTKKQVSSVKKPKEKDAVAEGQNGVSAAAKPKAKKVEEKSRDFTSRRVWPD